MYVVAENKNSYSTSIINNKVYNTQITNLESKKHKAVISNNYDTKVSFIELKIRKDLLAKKTSSYIYNAYDKYTEFQFTNTNKLHLRGNCYSYNMNLNKNAKVNRTIIFENINTYKSYYKDLGSITTGDYNVILPVKDNLDKTRAWYDKELDISDLPKGKYIIYIRTEANIIDIGEMREKLGRSLNSVKNTINKKDYSFIINKNRGNRIELVIK